MSKLDNNSCSVTGIQKLFTFCIFNRLCLKAKKKNIVGKKLFPALKYAQFVSRKRVSCIDQ